MQCMFRTCFIRDGHQEVFQLPMTGGHDMTSVRRAAYLLLSAIFVVAIWIFPFDGFGTAARLSASLILVIPAAVVLVLCWRPFLVASVLFASGLAGVFITMGIGYELLVLGLGGSLLLLEVCGQISSKTVMVQRRSTASDGSRY